ncbi:hypothetical protein BT96DRAFT_505065 [Gymnopus androsaceus JB14]|uniref:Uncharacterized protein n=1 Tax=Gymnopus androsaceus JB14 TaxID=1447944 RepID=A0A6A4I2L8_9AGAR|nr:hypothetical protein BT96DRAFT_505065 [Gymnopus androsaceus JB14]
MSVQCKRYHAVPASCAIPIGFLWSFDCRLVVFRFFYKVHGTRQLVNTIMMTKKPTPSHTKARNYRCEYKMNLIATMVRAPFLATILPYMGRNYDAVHCFTSSRSSFTVFFLSTQSAQFHVLGPLGK